MTPSIATQPLALVVDDDPLIRMDAASILEDSGFSTFEAADASAALGFLEAHYRDIQVLFTDVQMPGGMDGFALARHTSVCWPNISIVVASGHLKPGPDDIPASATFIPKPFSAQVVRHHLSETVPLQARPEPLKSLS